MSAKKVPLIVFEDSSKSGFGGGQRVTSQTLNILAAEEKYNFFVIDFFNPLNSNNIFYQKVKGIPGTTYFKLFVNLFNIKSSRSRSSNSIYAFEFLAYPFCFFANSISAFFLYLFFWIKFSRKPVLYVCAKSPLFLTLCLWLLSPRIIYHSHNVNSSGKLDKLVKLVIALANVEVIAVSSAARFGSSDLIIPNPSGVFIKLPTEDSLSRKYQKKIFTTMSNHIGWKGLNSFVFAAHTVNQKRNDLYYRIYGSGPITNQLSESINELRVEGMKIFGYTEDVGKILLEDAYCVVLPSLAPEACPMILIEALTLGVPILTTAIGGQYEFLPTCLREYAYTPNDVEGLSRSIDKMASLSYSCYNKLCDEMISHSKTFSPETYASKILSLFS